jgi:glycosyltransferase involved in cell wall biosynthesis
MNFESPTLTDTIRVLSYDTLESARSAGKDHRRGTVRLSVVVPCFNVECFIRDTCNSIANNACHADLEVIVVNDGSTDRSAEIASDVLGKAGMPATVVSIPNSGLSAARNVGLEFASAPYIAFLDSDDMMSADAYGQMLQAAEAGSCDQLFARTSAFDDWRGNDFEFFDSWIWNNILSGLTVRYFRPEDEPIVFMTEPKTCTRIWRTEFLRKNNFRFPEGRLFEDAGLHVQALAKSKFVGIIDIQGLVYRAGRSGALTLDRSRRRFDVLHNISASLASTEVRELPAEAGAYVLLAFMRISEWCRDNVHLRLRREFNNALGRMMAEIPTSWYGALYEHDPNEAIRFLKMAAEGSSFPTRLRLLTVRTTLRLTKKWRRHLTVWRGLGDVLPPSPLAPTPRFHFNEVRSLGPGIAAAAVDAHIGFLSPDTAARALRVARSRPQSCVHAIRPADERLHAAMAACGNLHIHRTSAELIAAAESEGMHLALVDLGQEADVSTLSEIANLHIDFIAGSFDSLAVPDTAGFLKRCRAIARRGYLLRRADGQSYSSSHTSKGPAVSVVVPVYNVLAYLDACVGSLSRQTLLDREIILVDDGATDGSGLRCDEWAAKDPTIRVIHKPNGGCASARMAGLQAAQGEYVTFVDGDDWADPSMLERLFDTALLSGSAVVEGGWCLAFPSDNTDDRTGSERGQTYLSRGGVLRRKRDTALSDQPTIWRRLYRRDFLKAHDIGFDIGLRRFDDMPFQFKTLSRSDDIPYVDACLLYYRQNREGQDIGITDNRLFVHFPITAIMREFALASGDTNIYRSFLRVQCNTHAWAASKIEKKYLKSYRRMMARDLFGPEQLEGSWGSFTLMIWLMPERWADLARLFLSYQLGARHERLPGIQEVR